MLQTILIISAAWLILAVLGWLALGLLDSTRRAALLPAAPVVGLAVLICALHYTGLVMSVSGGMWLVGGAAVVVAALNFRRDRRWWVVPRTAWLWAAVAVIGGCVCGSIVLLPTARTGDSRVVQVTPNNDAFYYVSLVTWLEAHRATEVPHLAPTPGPLVDPPSDLTPAGHLGRHMRIGQELAEAGVTTVLGKRSVDTWYPLTALWLMLLPAAGFAAALALRMRAASGIALGVLTSVAALTVFQMGAQNSDSLLGITLAAPAIAAVVAAFGRTRSFPLPFAALLLAAWMGTYSEFAPLVVPALLVGVVLRRPAEIPQALRRAAVVLGAGVLIAPLAWANAVRSLLFIGGIGSEGMRSAFTGVSRWALVNRFTGAAPLTSGVSARAAGIVLALGLIAGVVAAVALSRRRAFMLVLALTGGGTAYYLVTIKHRPYSQQRTVELWLPLVLLVAVFGYDRLITWLRGPKEAGVTVNTSRRTARVAGLLVACTLALAWVGVNISTDLKLPWRSAATKRHVDTSFAQAAGWVRAVGGPGGKDVVVATGDFFDQLWITDALRTHRLVSYADLFISYQAYPRFWDGSPRHWLLVDRKVLVHAPPSAIVHSNARFRLLDLSRGPILAVCTADEFYRGNVVVLRSADAPTTVSLVGTVVKRRLGNRAARRAVDGTQLPPGTLTPRTRVITLDVPGAGAYFQLNQTGLQFVQRGFADAPDI